ALRNADHRPVGVREDAGDQQGRGPRPLRGGVVGGAGRGRREGRRGVRQNRRRREVGGRRPGERLGPGGDDLPGGRAGPAEGIPGRAEAGADREGGRQADRGGAVVIDPRKAKLLFSTRAPGAMFGAALDGEKNVLYAAGSDGALYAVNLKDEK